MLKLGKKKGASLLTYGELTNLEYRVIFDYYDCPLSFIAYINSRNYLFYLLDDENYFIAELIRKDVELLSIHKDLTVFFNQLVKEDRMELITFDYKNETVTWTDLLNREACAYFPKGSNIIETDFAAPGVDIAADYRFEDRLEFI